MKHKVVNLGILIFSAELLVKTVIMLIVPDRLTPFCKLIRFLVKEFAKDVNTTPSLIIKPIPNIINFTSLGFNMISSLLKISQVSPLTFLTSLGFVLY